MFVFGKQTVIISMIGIIIVIVGFFVLSELTLENDSSLNEDSSKTFVKKQMNHCKGDTLCISEKIIRIIDGDTIHLEDGHKIRISLTNTPEIYQKGYNEAAKFTANLCPIGTIAIVDQDDLQPYDKFNRLVGKVICGDKILNAELLYNNHAKILTQYCSTSEFANEQWARKYGC